jgi:predicted amidohydrolase
MAARNANVDVAIGVVELDSITRGTVYCTLLFISRDGQILGRHRKLKPSGAERTVWGEGDGVGLMVYERPYGRISGLNCWEHRMLLPGYALMALGTQIHVATWPFSWHLDPDLNNAPLVSQVFAAQGGCYVIATSALLRPEDVQEPYRELARSKIEQWIGAKKGGCRIIAPGGRVIAQAAAGEETILTASGSLEAALQAKAEVGFIGLSNHDVDVARMAVESGLIDVLRFPINLYEHPADPARAVLLEKCAQHHVGVVAMKPY